MGLLDKPLVSEMVEKENRYRLEQKANKYLKKRKIRRGKKKKNKRKVPKMSYRQYMKSSYWRKRKNDYFGKYGKKCAVCGKKYGVTLHHKKYDNQLNGKEPDNFFVALCGKHHWEFHKNHKLAKNMEEETDLYVYTAKQLNSSNIDDLSWI